MTRADQSSNITGKASGKRRLIIICAAAVIIIGVYWVLPFDKLFPPITSGEEINDLKAMSLLIRPYKEGDTIAGKWRIQGIEAAEGSDCAAAVIISGAGNKPAFEFCIKNKTAGTPAYMESKSFQFYYISKSLGSDVSGNDIDVLMRRLCAAVEANDPGGMRLDIQKKRFDTLPIVPSRIRVGGLDRRTAFFIIFILCLPFAATLHFLYSYPVKPGLRAGLFYIAVLAAAAAVLLRLMPRYNYFIYDFSEYRAFVSIDSVRQLADMLFPREALKTPPYLRFIPELINFFTNKLEMLRMPSALILFFFVPFVVFRAGRGTLDKWQAAVLLGGLMLNEFVLGMAFSMRGYTLVLFFTLAATLCFSIYVEKRDRRAARWMVFFLAAASWTFYFACLYAGCLFAALLWEFRADRKELKRVVLFAAVYLLSVAPFFVAWSKLYTYWTTGGEQSESRMVPASQLSKLGFNLLLLFPMLHCFWSWRHKTFRYLFVATAICLLANHFLAQVFFVYQRYMIPFFVPGMFCNSYILKAGGSRSAARRIVQMVFIYSSVLFVVAGVRAVGKENGMSDVVSFFRKNRSETNMILLSQKSYSNHLYYYLEGRILDDRCTSTYDEVATVGCGAGSYRIMVDRLLPVVAATARKGNGRFFYLRDRSDERLSRKRSKKFNQLLKHTDSYKILDRRCDPRMSNKSFTIYACEAGDIPSR